MLIYGHRFIQSASFYHIQSIEAIQNSPSSSTLLLEFSENNLDIIEHLKANSIDFAIEVDNITDTMYASALGASFIIVQKDLASTVQSIANNYLFDAKVLVLVEEEADIEEMAILGVDGIIFSNAIIKINS